MKFTAAFKRNNQEVKLIPNAQTKDGFLLNASNLPCFDSEVVAQNGWQNEVKNKKLSQIVGTKYESALIRFGKHEGYWVWNEDARKKKEVESKKTVTFKHRKTDPYDYETEAFFCGSISDYPAEIRTLIESCCYKEKKFNSYSYVLNDETELKNGLEALGWELKIY